ncbi:hypothetical protein Sru01_20370 [Sphaerisporangium rufum]|uniref:rRNA methyltransferase n=1 Tax=Sphaerisporangium rufum TaxID=1381558 RepID=A0A919V4A1_9ACTN|nr:rRNA methyltransferase [Sphaerisporangium rufum]GII77055.1 hypothetical protein Sru01_20370 [Sphaerisporangium rufum]
MTYRHATVRENHQDLASGAVLHSAAGFPAFPVRLASEVFQRALELRGKEPVTVWDPCCGSGYLVTVIALLHRRQIKAVLASDIAPEALRLAEQNLGLLSRTGLTARADHLDGLAERWGKPSYAAAAQAAGRLRRRLSADGGDVPTAVRHADVFDPDVLEMLGGARPDIVITDVPYGEQTSWRGPGAKTGISGMVRTLASTLAEDTVIAVAARGRTIPLDDGLRPRTTFKIGTRTVALFQNALRPTLSGSP